MPIVLRCFVALLKNSDDSRCSGYAYRHLASFNDNRLSISVKDFIDQTADKAQQIAISSISLVEIIYLMEKERLHASVYEHVMEALENPALIFVEASLTSEIVNDLHKISRDIVPDMPDRIIAATAVHFDVPLLTRDRRIRSANLHTIW